MHFVSLKRKLENKKVIFFMKKEKKKKLAGRQEGARLEEQKSKIEEKVLIKRKLRIVQEIRPIY